MATADLALTTSTACDVLRLITDRRVRRENAATLIERIFHDPATPAESLARSAGLLTDQNDAGLPEAIRTALDALHLTPEKVRRNQGRNAAGYPAAYSARSAAHTNLNPRATADHIERLWDPPE